MPTINGAETSDNVISGISIRDDAGGILTATITNAKAIGNTGRGIDFDERGAGDLIASVSKSTATGNTLFGIRASQQLASGAGVGTLQLTTVTLTGNTLGETQLVNTTATVLP